MQFDFMSIMAYVFGLILIYILCWVFIRPLKWVFKLIINGILGGLILAAINMFGGLLGMSIVINPVTSLITGILGIPGVALILLLQWIL